jgi:DNA topoisomerase-1
MDAITHAEAMELFKLPRKLGTTSAGEEITTNVGRFGPYVKYGAKYVSLKIDDPYEITPERALEVIRDKEIADANRLILDFPDAGIQVLNGRYGPYITDKSRNAKIPKDKEPKSLSLEECQTLLAAAPVRTFGKWGRKGTPKGQAMNGKGGKPKGPADATAEGPAGAPKKRAAKSAAAAPVAAATVRPATARPAAARTGTPTRLAAKGVKAAANKKAPATAAALPKGAPGAAPKAASKAKKSSAKKKS